ncbi:MAG: PmoA family protein [Armatimonadetes bacterium]|nr:PmoA family protein [Armatimonadota bacterium]
MSDHGILVEVDAGYHDRENTVVYGCCSCDTDCEGGHVVHEVLDNGELGEPLPAQCVGTCECNDGDSDECECTVAWIVPFLAAGEKKRYVICADERTPEDAGSVTVEMEEGKSASFLINGELFTRYNFDREQFVRPNAFPVLGPGGVHVTEYAESDHPHHKSLYVALGEVNGFNNWDEQEGHAYIYNQSVDVLAEGPIFAQIMAINDWVDPKGNKYMEDWTVITVYNSPEGGRFMDWDITLAATECGIHIGDTKESGTISVRMNTPLHVRHGGTMVNAYGGVNEGENWGKPSPWVDYYGEVDGVKCGLALMDSPGNLRHPTTWHVRDYGLFTANCWGYSYFTGDQSIRGDYTMPEGATLNFLYRVYVHGGDHLEAKTGDRYFDFAFPPEVTPVEED